MKFKRFVGILLSLMLVISLLPGQLFVPADAADPVYGTYAEAVEDLRAGLVQRKSSVTVYLKYGGAPIGSFPTQLMDAAREHTGVPNEGDYITRAMIGCLYDVDYYVEGGTYYVTATFTPDWLTTAGQEAEVDAAVDALLEELDLWGKEEYEIITGVYDWVTENVQYDFDNYDDNANSIKHTVYAALINRCCLCQGFSTLLYRLLLELGVDCRVITGTADGEGHAWNIVKLGDVYYNCDPTWDRDLKGYYRNFLCSDANFPDHTRGSKYTTAKFTAAYPMADTSYVIKVNASGTVTSGITWELDAETGCLYVTGTGVIPGYRFSSPPWDEYVDNVQSIVISEGITEVGERAFAWCKNATSLTLPSTLKTIREYGFNNLRSLQYVTLPEGLTKLESCAFSECAALREIVLPDSVTSVGSSAFSNCQNLRRAVVSAGMTHIPNSMFFNDTSLAEVVIPDSVTSIGDTAFRCCNGLKTFTIPAHMTSLGAAAISDCTGMTHIYVDEGNPVYTDIDGVLYSADGKTLITFPAGRTTSYTVPAGTEIIGDSAFCRNVKLRTVYFPDSVRRIEDYAFAWCENLQSVTLGENIDFVGEYAFYSCRYMTSVTFENPDVVLEGCFGECDSLVTVDLPAGLKEIPGYMFYGCAYLTVIEFPAGVTSIGSSAFLDCDSLTRVTIPGHIKTVGRQAFDYCSRLRVVTIESGVTRLEDYSFRSSPNLTKVVIPRSVTYIGKECFFDCPNVTLWCEYGSAAYRYAVQHGIPYVDTHVHNYDIVTFVPPTCVEQGYTFHSCVCGDGYATDYVGTTDHTMGTWWESYPPTCTEPGEECRYCFDCSYYESREIPATGHIYETTENYPPTCTEPGYTILTCMVCWDSMQETRTTDITELFTWTDGKMILATSGACTDYAHWRASDYVDVSVFDTLEIKTADTIYGSTTTGLAFYDANKNYISGITHTDGVGETYGTLIHTLEIPENAVYIRSTWYAPVHPDYDSAFGEFSCRGTGQYVPAAGHSYEVTDYAAPTCTGQGHTTYTCTVCGDRYTEYTERAEHTYSDGICTLCGVSILGSSWLAPEFAEGDYTMVVVPDTQILVEKWPQIYRNQMQWIADNRDALNIQAVLHMGDMVNTNNDAQWTVCREGTDMINAAGIPWMPMRGNHDDSAWFNRYYGYEDCGTDQSWFGGSYEEGKLDHTYWFVTAGQREYMVLSLGWAPTWDVLEWAQGIVEEHSSKSVILTCHAYMNKDGSLLSGSDSLDASSYVSGVPSGEEVWAAFKDYGNVVLAMGGHIHSPDVVTWVDTNGAGKEVTSLLFDRQDDDISDRYAMVALLTFHADSDTVDINWYSTRYDALYKADNQFSVSVPHICAHTYSSGVCTLCGAILYGDTNGDGKVTVTDLAMLRKYLANKDPVTGESTIVLGPRN